MLPVQVNGVSIGGIMGLYSSKGIFPLLLAFMAPHGVLELSAICIAAGGGFLVAALGVATKQYWLVVLGYGGLGGIVNCVA